MTDHPTTQRFIWISVELLDASWILKLSRTVGIMSTKQRAQAKKMKAAAEAAPNDTTGEDDDDVGVLIYREVQLRKAESAAESKNTSTASTHRRTSTRKRTPVQDQNGESLPSSQQQTGASKRRKRESSVEEVRPKKKVAKKRGANMDALLMDARTKPGSEECALGMGQRSTEERNALLMDAQT